MMELSNRVVLVTGAGRGIGQAIALGCALQGASVALASRSVSELEETADLIRKRSTGEVISLRCDVGDSQEVRNLVDKTEKTLGPIFGLVCAAGVYGPIGSFEDVSIEEWERGINVNLFGTARCVHAVLPGMKKRGGGRIIAFSGGGQAAYPHFSAYVTAKGGIWRFTETVGAEIAPYGVYLNAIAPGAVNTRFLDELLEAGPEKAGFETYSKALKQKENGGTSTEKALQLVLYLLSEKSKGLSGKILSAVWDRYEEIDNPEAVSKSDLFTMRRVTSPDGGTRA